MTNNNLWFGFTTFFRKLSISTKVLILIFLHLALIVINAYYLHSFLKETQLDAQFINESGVIRGTIQKVVKLETNKIEANKEINRVDHLLDKHINLRSNDILVSNFKSYIKGVEQVKNGWQLMKKHILEYRESNNKEIKEVLIAESEKCWSNSNHTVGIAQFNAERKHNLFYRLYVIMLIDFILMVSIIFIIYLFFKLKIEEQAQIDPLTKTYNRHYFYEELQTEMLSSVRYNYPLSLILLDIDFFKKINDTFGHDEGDRVLTEIASLMQKNIRQEDTLCRFGGEEFVIITPFIESEKVKDFSEKLRLEVQNYDFGNVGTVTISLGIATQKQDDTYTTLFKRADQALYTSKNNGRNCVT